jgi:cellulose biosynthesis protein BcsQ
MATIRFNDALRIAAFAMQSPTLPADWPVRIIRDVYGRIRFAINCELEQYPEAARLQLEAVQKHLGNFATSANVLFRDDFSNPDAIFNSADWHRTTVSPSVDEDGVTAADVTVSVLDRQITGQDWLNAATSDATKHPHRLVFYGLKGGVGRSTALAMVAYGLARQGKRVLLVDFDLESPGLSGLLLPPERVAEYGLVDWFVEDAVGQGDDVLRSMVSTSPLADTTTGAIRVAAAMGQAEHAYLTKLARAYADIPDTAGPQRFASRMRRVVELLEAQEQPDVVLIDSRAGLHDIAAVSITSLADTALLFANDSAQNWLGYEQLFAHWQHRPSVCAHVRERLAIVQALAPKSDREGRSKAFLNHAYELFSGKLYDEIAPPTKAPVQLTMESMIDLYNPAMEDEAAPHFPIRVDWDEVFQEFDPKLRPEQGGVSDAEVEAKFGALISWVKTRVAGASDE